MARNNKNSINVSIFTALKVSEKSGVPVLLLSNPGVGKTTTVEIYAELRDMKVVALHGNQTSPEEVNGYDTCPSNVDTTHISSSVHLRPSWFNLIMDYKKKGIRTLLFLDELTTANEFVQAALLKVIFERKCGEEFLPEDTLIVAAGNYISNLTTSMTVISPMINRFMVYNITPEASDLESFLCRYEGALVNDGKPNNQMEDLRKQLSEIDNQELSIDEIKRNKIGEYIERAIKETTRMLITSGDRPVDLSVTDLKDVYNDVDDTDPNLYGFPTMRTLNYLRDVTVACYCCFGSAGLQSSNYKKMIDGLCGIGLKKEFKGNTCDIKKTKIGSNYFDQIGKVIKDIEKMDNNKVPSYEKFFSDMYKASSSRKENKGVFTLPEMQSIINKIKELNNDPEMKGIERPLEVNTIKKLYEISYATSSPICADLKCSTGQKILDHITIEEFMGNVTEWNVVAELVTNINNLVTSKSANYASETINTASGYSEKFRGTAYKLKSIKKLMSEELKNNDKDTGIAKVIPEIANINCSKVN